MRRCLHARAQTLPHRLADAPHRDSARPHNAYAEVSAAQRAVKQALQYEEVLASGEVDSQTELARLSGIPRTTISAYLRLLRLLRLDASVRSEALHVGEDDVRIGVLTEARLRALVGLEPSEQRRQFRALLGMTGEATGRASR